MSTIATVFGAILVAVASFFVGIGYGTDSPSAGGNTVDDETFQADVTVEGITQVREFAQGGGVLNIATAASSYTLTADEMKNANVIEIEAQSPQAALALTLPTAAALNSAGVFSEDAKFREWIIEDNHTAAATTTTITAGTNIDLVAVTTADDVIDGGEMSRLSCWRKEDDTVGCIVSELLAAD